MGNNDDDRRQKNEALKEAYAAIQAARHIELATKRQARGIEIRDD